MFSNIAGRYDLANDVLSLGIHRLWRRRALDMSNISAGQKVLDVCTGTGDFAFLIAKEVGPSGEVVGLDFVDGMLACARAKIAKHTDVPKGVLNFIQGDAMQLPFEDHYFDALTIGFGIRNTDDPLLALKEFGRVLKPSGTLVVLEFGQMQIPIIAPAYNFYCKYFMPHIGKLLTGDKSAYEYLPKTSRLFPAGEEFAKYLHEAEYKRVRSERLLGGMAYIYVAENNPNSRSSDVAIEQSSNHLLKGTI